MIPKIQAYFFNLIYKVKKQVFNVPFDYCWMHFHQMKSSFVIFAATICFLLGLGFYHYLLGYRAIFNDPSRRPVYINDGFSVAVPTGNAKPHEWISMREALKGPFAQNDSRLLQYINANNIIRPPSDKPYNLSNPDLDNPSMGQSRIVLHALNGLKNGFFVECGALDGELRSNTLLLEKRFGWKGLLIEGDPKNYDMLVDKHRKAWSTPACLSTLPYPHEVLFEQHYNTGKISKQQVVKDQEAPPGFARVQCYPFYTLISAMNISTVDYFSLDVEGSELDVLHTIPFDSVFIKVISVEYIHDSGGRNAVKQFMTARGFRVFGEVTDPRNWANDLVLVNERLLI